MDNIDDWASALQPGDSVIEWSGSGWSRTPNVGVVQRTTATQVIVGGRKYRKQDGREVGHRYGNHIEPVTLDIRDEIAARNRRRIAMNIVADIVWHRESTAVLEAMAETYKIARAVEKPVSADAVDPQAGSTGTPSTREKSSFVTPPVATQEPAQ